MGYTGHRIIAEIAEQFLELETARQVRDLFAVDNMTALAEVSTWADQIRVQRPETAPWHYVNIPVHPATDESGGYDATREAGKRLACGCGGGCCLFARAPSSTFGNDAYSTPARQTGRGHKHRLKYP